MTPFRFGPKDRPLCGVFHAALGQGLRSEAVLICGPFGQEGVRTHRFFRILAERLARNGLSALRFDYFGAGDSGGDDLDAELVGWTCDVKAAHQELVRRTGATAITWIGARLGATVAICAALATKVHRLVLWEPIVDGPAYLDELRRSHELALIANFGKSVLGRVRNPDAELLGFGVSEKLRQQLRALGPGLLTLPSERPIDVLLSAGSVPARRWVEVERDRGARVELRGLDLNFDWTSEEAMNTALVPPEALSLLSRLLVRAQ